MEGFRPNFCPNLVGYYVNSWGEYKLIGCKQWTCPYCGLVRKRKLLDEVNSAFLSEERIRFCTLTLRHTENERTNLLLNKRMSKYWARLRARLYKRGYSKESFKYFYTVEVTKNGMLQYHVLWNIYVDADLLRKMWFECTEKTSYRISLNEVDVRSPGGYMAKYLTKALSFDIVDKRIRRYGFSYNIERRKFVPESEYKWVPMYAVPSEVLYEHSKLTENLDYSFVDVQEVTDDMMKARSGRKTLLNGKNGPFYDKFGVLVDERGYEISVCKPMKNRDKSTEKTTIFDY